MINSKGLICFLFLIIIVLILSYFYIYHQNEIKFRNIESFIYGDFTSANLDSKNTWEQNYPADYVANYISLDGKKNVTDPERYFDTGKLFTSTDNLNESQCTAKCYTQPECQHPNNQCQYLFDASANCICQFKKAERIQYTGILGELQDKANALPFAIVASWIDTYTSNTWRKFLQRDLTQVKYFSSKTNVNVPVNFTQNNMAISFWIYFNDSFENSNSNKPIFQMSNLLNIYFTNTPVLRVDVSTIGAFSTSSSIGDNFIAFGTPKHIIISFYNGSYSMYINGDLKNKVIFNDLFKEPSPDTMTTSGTLGNTTLTSLSLKDIKVYNQQLTNRDAKQLYTEIKTSMIMDNSWINPPL